jgi:hypothetical protein
MGNPYAALVSMAEAMSTNRGITATQLRGTGNKIWKWDAAAEVSRLRDEWQ